MAKNEGRMNLNDYSAKSQWPAASAADVSGREESSWKRNDWQRMWLCTQSREWRTLALVPGDEYTSTFDVANLIVRRALDHGETIQVADLREISLQRVDSFLERSRWGAGQSGRVIFATESASVNLATVPLARSADCAILCVSLGRTRLDAVRNSVEQIGRERFLGSLLVTASVESDSRKPVPSQLRSGFKARR